MLYPDPNLGYDLSPMSAQDGQVSQQQQEGAGLGPVPSVAAIRGFVPMRDLFVVKNEQGQVIQILPQTPVERRHILLPDARGSMSPDGELLGGGGENSQLFHYLQQALVPEELVAVCHFKNPQQSDSRDCCFIMPIQTAGQSDKGVAVQLTLFIPRLAGDTGTLPLHMLTQTPMQRILTMDLRTKAPVQTENPPTPETLQTDLAKFMKTLSKLPATKDIAYKDCERLRKSSQIYLMPSLREAVVTMLESAESECYQGNSKEDSIAQFYLKDLIKQMSRQDATQAISVPKEPSQSTQSGRGSSRREKSKDQSDKERQEKEKSNAASINNLLC